jgi:NAD(P)H dehydrogenase (quinone)
MLPPGAAVGGCIQVPDLVPEKNARSAYFKIDQSVPVATGGELQDDDAIVLGMPTRLGRMASQLASFLDQGGVWARGQLGSVMSSTAG